MELHLVKVVVEIDSVKINIRFPGQLSFQLKNTFLFQDINKLFPLTDGYCEVAQTIAFQTQAIYSLTSQKYTDIPVDLIISVNTVSGKIVAGSVTFNLLENKTALLSLKRCSDKNAAVSLSITYAKINKIKDIEGKSIPLKTIEKLQTSPIVSLASPITRTNYAFEKNEFREKGERSNSKSSQDNLKNLMGSRGKTLALDSKLKELEQSTQRRLKVANKEKEDIQLQLEQTREKWRVTQRKERQAMNVIKQLKEGNEKKRIKISDLQTKLFDYDRVILQNEKKLKQLQQQLKQSKQSLEQAHSKNVLLQKRLDARDQAANQREKRLLQKVQQGEIENNKITFQYNQLLEKMQSQQKTSQNLNKIKDRTYVQEKSKLKQTLDRLQQENKLLKQQISQNSEKQVSIIQLQHILTTKLKQLEKQFEAQNAIMLSQKAQLDRQSYARIQYEREIQKLKEFQSDKGILKKRLAEQSQQNQKIKDKLDKLTLEYQESRDQCNKYQIQNQQLRKEKKTLINKSNQLQRTNSTLQREINRIQAEINGLSAKNCFLNERVSDYKIKFQQQQSQFNEKQEGWINKFNSIIQSKQYVLSDAEDLKWALQREKERVAQAEKRLKEKNQVVLEQEQELINLQKQIDSRGLLMVQSNNQTSLLKRQIEDLKQKERVNLQLIKDSERKAFEMGKKIAQIEQSYFFNLNKLQIQRADNLERIRSHEVTIQDLTQELTSKKEGLSDSHKDYEILEQKFRQLSRNYKLKQISLEEAQKAKQQGQQQSAQLKRLNEELRKKLYISQETTDNESKQYSEKINKLKQKLQQKEQENKAKQSDLQSYKIAVEQLLIIISKDSQNDEQIIAFPNKELSKMQMEALLKRSRLISNFTNKISELEMDISYLQKQNQNKQKNNERKFEEYQNLIKQNNQKHLQYVTLTEQKQTQLNVQLQNSLIQIKNLTSQKQKLEVKGKGLREIIEELQSQKQNVAFNFERSKQKIKQLQFQLLQSKSIKTGIDQSQVQNIKISFSREIQSYKEKSNNLLKQKQKMQKSSNQKDKHILILEDRIKQLEIQLNYKDGNLQNQKKSYDKLTNDKNALQQQYLQLQQKNTKLNDKLESIQQKLKSENQLKAERQKTLNLLREEVSQLAILKEKFENKLVNNQKILENTITDYKNKLLTYQSNYQNQQKKNLQLSQKLQIKVNQLQIKYFQMKQLQQNLQTSKSQNRQFKKDNQDKKNQISKLTLALEQRKRQIQDISRQKSEHLLEKDSTYQTLELKKKENEQLYIQINQQKNKIQCLMNQLSTTKLQNQDLTKQKLQLINNNQQLKQTIAETKKDIFKLNSRENQLKRNLSSLQQQLKDKQEFYQIHKSKNWDESQRQINSYKEKAKKSQSKYQQMLKLWEGQKEELKYQNQSLLQDRDQLEEMLQDREQLIQQQQLEIMQSQKRVISLNSELRSCLQAWEKQKAASIPSRRQADKIQEELSRFQQYANELDKKTKEALTMSVSKVRDDMMAKTAKALIELLELQHKIKTKALSLVAESQRSQVSKDYDKMKEVIQKILQNQNNPVQK